MKRFHGLLFFSLVFLPACNHHEHEKKSMVNESANIVSAKGKKKDTGRQKKEVGFQPAGIPVNASEGDFDGDGIIEYVWLVPPALDSTGEDCLGNCSSVLRFSNPAIPEITVAQCIGGLPLAKGNLNAEAGDELGLLPEWFKSCWNGYQVYTLKGNQWIHAVEPFSTHCSQWKAGINPIQKDKIHPGNVLIRYSEMTEEGIVLKEKSVKIN